MNVPNISNIPRWAIQWRKKIRWEKNVANVNTSLGDLGKMGARTKGCEEYTTEK